RQAPRVGAPPSRITRRFSTEVLLLPHQEAGLVNLQLAVNTPGQRSRRRRLQPDPWSPLVLTLNRPAPACPHWATTGALSPSSSRIVAGSPCSPAAALRIARRLEPQACGVTPAPDQTGLGAPLPYWLTGAVRISR